MFSHCVLVCNVLLWYCGHFTILLCGFSISKYIPKPQKINIGMSIQNVRLIMFLQSIMFLVVWILMHYATPLLVLLQHLVDRFNDNTCDNIRILWNIESKRCTIIHVFAYYQTLDVTDATFIKELLVKNYIFYQTLKVNDLQSFMYLRVKCFPIIPIFTLETWSRMW